MPTSTPHPALRLARSIGVFILAVVLVSVAGSLVQTQINLAALASIGAEISLADRLDTTLADLAGFAPIYALVVFSSLVLAFPVAALLGRFWLAKWRTGLFVLAGASGLYVGFLMLNALTPPPTLIAATRGAFGTLLLVACSGAGGWFYARLSRFPASKY